MNKDQEAYFQSASDAADLIARTLPLTDNVAPSGNAIMIKALALLHHQSGVERYRDQALKTFNFISTNFIDEPGSIPSALSYFALIERPIHIFVSGDPKKNLFKDLIRVIYERPMPNLILTQVHAGTPATIKNPMFEKIDANGPPTAYVCANQTCFPPIASTEKLREELSKLSA